MKKTVLFTAALFAVTAVSAQTGEITSNRGENWLSQDGDWGLTFEATPLLNYAGNLFNGNAGNGGVALGSLFSTAGAAGINGNQVVIGGKKLIDANTAYRGRVRLGFGSNKETAKVDDVASTDPEVLVDDVTKNGFMGIDLGFGLEKRVGSTRVVGVYGAMLNVGFGSSKTTYEYGNAISATNPVASRVTETKNGSTMAVGLQAFAGVEWFCAPKISLSGEYTWGLALSSTGFGSQTSEGWDGSSVTTTTVDGTTNKKNSFSLDTGVSGASIGVNFYFQ
ncbi:MAG: hypothetical protein KJZ58_08335 [Flavobacteriales bacterium]|nr:hypothetical protein [Flavobacteriales bacterium]